MKSYSSCALHFKSLPETCIPSMESFERMVIKLCSGQQMLYKNQTKGNYLKMEQSRFAVLVHRTSSHCQKHANQVYSHLNLWWQSYALDKKYSTNQSMGNNSKTEQGRVTIVVHCSTSFCQKPTLTKVIPICRLDRRHKNWQMLYFWILAKNIM